MKICGYCGRHSDDTAQFCAECGQTLTATNIAQPDRAVTASAARPRLAMRGILNARSASIIFLCYFGVEILLGAVSGVLRGTGNALAAQRTSEGFTTAATWILLMTPVITGIAMMKLSARLVRQNLRDTSPEGAAWVGGSHLGIAVGLLVGLTVGTGAHFFPSLMAPLVSHPVRHKDILLSQGAAFGTGIQQLVRLATQNLVAPAFQELLFRGIIYGGFRRSFGSKWATIVSTLIFLAVHLPISIRYPNVTICLTALSLAALCVRLKSQAIGPAIAVHVGYNFILSFDYIASKLIGS
jgi:membrane protease YdiL (CAAX protease family)